MEITEIIYKKRNSGRLTSDEIRFAVTSYTEGKIPDYQMSALLMSIFFRGLDSEETAFLTAAMLESGERLDLSKIKGPKIDKHSTGGVGDGTSLIVAPLAASLGIVVPMMAGRALGHTGGTLDKLESIPGLKVNLSKERFVSGLEKIGFAIMGQTESIAPADKKIYALRDVTATIDSIPLIASSIMSKKLAEGSDGLVLDIKRGSGAFMEDSTSAKALAQELIKIAKQFDKKAIALITDMNQPLGNAVGNSVEIRQAIEVMKGKGPEDITKLVIELTERMILLSGESNVRGIKKLVQENLANGKALSKFREMIEFQGGDPRVIDEPGKFLPSAAKSLEILSYQKGFVEYVNTRNIGVAATLLGAGRSKKEEVLDHSAGIILHKKQGDRIEPDEPLATFYFNDESRVEEAKLRFGSSMKVTHAKPKKLEMIHDELTNI